MFVWNIFDIRMNFDNIVITPTIWSWENKTFCWKYKIILFHLLQNQTHM